MKDVRLMIGFFILGAVAVLYPTWLIFWDTAPVENRNFTMNPPMVHPGDVLTMHWEARAFKDCGGEQHQYEIAMTGEKFYYDIDWKLKPKPADGQWHPYARFWTTPLSMPLGNAVHARDLVRWCNWLQKWKFPIREHLETPYTVY